jgi:3-deoxy-7-phosphoheptulonate synthase
MDTATQTRTLDTSHSTASTIAAGAIGRPPAYRLASRVTHPSDTVVKVGGVCIGGDHFTVIAGPCAVESRRQVLETADAVKEAGATMLRAGAYKPRTSPYDFQGLGIEGLEMLAEAREMTGLPVVSEVMDSEDVGIMAAYVDMFQIGARSMSSFRLLRKVATAGKPVLLKRGYQASMREWLLSAEYILAAGNDQVVMCERGIRTHDAEFTRNTLDLNAVPLLKLESHLPVLVDPSHGTGRADLVLPMSRAAAAAGCDGLLIEVHPDPAHALCDGKQSLTPEAFSALVTSIVPFAKLARKRELAWVS